MVPLLQTGNVDLPVRLDWIHRKNLDAVFRSKRLDQRIDTAQNFFVRIEGIDHEPDLHAGSRSLNELDDQVLGEVAGPDDVELNVNRGGGLVERGEETPARFSIVELRMKRVALDEMRFGGLIEAPIERIAARSVAQQLGRLLSFRRKVSGERPAESRRRRHEGHTFGAALLRLFVALGQNRRDRDALRTQPAYGGRRKHGDEIDA